MYNLLAHSAISIIVIPTHWSEYLNDVRDDIRNDEDIARDIYSARTSNQMHCTALRIQEGKLSHTISPCGRTTMTLEGILYMTVIHWNAGIHELLY